MNDKTDALVARLRMNARDCVRAADMDTDCVLSKGQIDDMADALKEAAEALAAQPAETAGDDKWVLIEQCVICHGSGYKPGVNGPRPCLNCDGEGSRSPPTAASVELIEAIRELRQRQRDYLSQPKGERIEAKGRLVGLAADRVDAALALIDSAGGAKVCTCPSGDGTLRWPCPTHPQTGHLMLPQPDGGPWPMTQAQVEQWIDACNHEPARQVLRDYLQLRTRPSAAAAVPGLDAGAYFWLARVLTTYGDKLSPSAMAIISERIAAAPAAPKGGAVDEAARALVVKIEAIHADPVYQGVWLCAHNHGIPYTGPKYDTELAALTAALANQEQRHD